MNGGRSPAGARAASPRTGAASVGIATAALAVLVAACGQIAPGGGSSATGRPQPTAEGTPIGAPATGTIGRPGGSVVSPDGLLGVEVPAGAVQAHVAFTVQPVTNLAPGSGAYPAWKLGPEGLTFAEPVTLTFHTAGLADVASLAVAWQDAQGYWLRVPASETVRDPAARTVTVRTTHFSVWTLVPYPPGTASDLEGRFTIASTVDLPVTVGGTAHWTFANDPSFPGPPYYYLLSGTAVFPDPYTVGVTTCSPDPATAADPLRPLDFPLRTNVAERFEGTEPRFDWGTSAAWQTTCSDLARRLVTVAFDDAGISYIGCTRGYDVGTTPVVGPARAFGSYTINCGARGTVTASWDFLDASCGQPCSSGNACRTATWDCSTGAAVCAETGNEPAGTPCGAGSACSAGACVASHTVSGTRLVRYWPDAGAQAQVPAPDVATARLVALLPNGPGAWTPVTATIDAGGNFAIPGLPAGRFWLQLTDGGGQTTLLDTAGDLPLDLGWDQLGRSGTTLAGASTPVDFSVTLPPGTTWSAANGDEIQIASSNADVWDRLALVSLAGDAASGTWRDDWYAGNASQLPLNLLTASDALTVYHMVGGVDAAGPFLAAGGSSTAADASLSSGAASTVTRALSTASLGSQALAGGTWSVSAFEALRTAMNLPLAAPATHAVTVGASVGPLATPGPSTRGPPTLFSMRLPGGTSPDPVLGGALAYNRVLDPVLWSEWRGVDFSGRVPFLLPGTSTSHDEMVSAGTREAMPASGALAPALSPVQGLSIITTAGATSPAYGSVSGVGLTPTLAWSAPPAGTATSYTVEVFRLGRSAAATTGTRVATFVTGATQVAFPPDILAAGNSYYARVRARSTAADPSAAAPLRAVVVGSYAEALTGTFSP